MAWVYILECADGSYYVGSTTDLDRRVWEHNEGLGAAYTRRRRPVALVWSTYFSRVDQAFAFEKQIQNWGRAKRQALIEGRTDDLSTLASRSDSARQERRGEKPASALRPTRITKLPTLPPAPDRETDPWAPPIESEEP